VYKHYNRKYFKNKLPTVWLHYGGKPGRSAHAETTWYSDGAMEIMINREFQRCGRLIRIFLLHEMAHVSLPNNAFHGPRYKARIKKLIRQGAYDNLL
jgi:hypothetical protein